MGLSNIMNKNIFVQSGKKEPLDNIAKRALKEAQIRRRKLAKEQGQMPREIGGTTGPEPTRYGDWEKKGIISDF